MLKVDFVPKIPYGAKDFLMREAGRKRALENKAADLFARWGYQEVVTPTFEYLDIFADSALSGQSFKFFDREAQALILRPDMTSPIARLALTRLREMPKPQRLFYIANVFRYEQAQTGRQCEFYQAGVELLGAGNAAADAEVVALAVETVKSAGLVDFKISLGNVGFLNGVIENGCPEREAREKLRALLSGRDLAGLDAYGEAVGLPGDLRGFLREVLFLHGGRDILDKAADLADNPVSRQALDNLAEIFSLLEHYGAAELVEFDLGLTRDFDYYTGMVFEGYTQGLGFPICGGGRYDNMLAAFGENCPAVGFAAGVDRLLLALARGQSEESAPLYLAWGQGGLPRALAMAGRLRAAGYKVEVALRAQDKESAVLQAKGREFIYAED